MKFRRLRCCNFRLLRDLKLSFATDASMPLTVIRAENETGKTTVMTALQWVLFGDDALPDPKQSYRLHPIDWDDSNHQEVDVSVELEFEHTWPPATSAPDAPPLTDIFVAKRSVRETIEPGGHSWVRSKPTLQLLKQTTNGFAPLPASGGSLILHQMLGSNLRELFFTDGDRALSFITADISQGEKRKMVQRAIRDMLGFEVLADSRKHTEKAIASIRQSVGGPTSSDIEKLGARLATIGEEIDIAVSKKEQADREKQDLAVQIATLTTKIEEALSRGDKEDLVRRLRSIGSALESSRNDLKRFSQDHASAFQLQGLAVVLCASAIERSRGLLDELKRKGKLPRTTVPILRERLEMGACICGTDLSPGSSARSFMEQTIKEQEATSNLDDRLTTLRVKARELIEAGTSPAEWLAKLKQVLADRTRTEKRILELEYQHKELDVQIGSIPDTDLSGLRQLKSACNARKEEAIRSESLETANINRLTYEKKNAEIEYTSLLKKNSALKRTQNQLNAASDILSVLKNTYEVIEKEQLPLVSESMDQYFLEMIGADDQAALIRSARVNDQFDIVVEGPGGKSLDPDRDLNGASRRALTLAFILALTEVSGVRAPNVIDTPLGMMSPQIKRSVLETAASHCDQLVLFLTRSEIRDIEDLLDRFAGRVQTMTNSSHFPKFLANPTECVGIQALTCDCSHRQVCHVCTRQGDEDQSGLTFRH